MQNYEIIRSSRKTLALQINGDRVLVRAPLKTPQEVIERFMAEHRDWIESHLEKNAEKMKKLAAVEPLSQLELKAIIKNAKQVIPQRTAYYAELMGLTYGRIAIRSQHTKWGSCSAKGNLNFNCLLMLAPPDVLDSVIVHELCHRVEMNHSKRFYALLYRYYPDYDNCHKWLKENGDTLMARLDNMPNRR